MPIQLTTAISGGDFESASLTHVMISQFIFSITPREINLRVQLGKMVDNALQHADVLHAGTVKDYVIAGADYDALIAVTASAQGAVLYDEVKDALYQWLIDKSHFAGTIV